MPFVGQSLIHCFPIKKKKITLQPIGLQNVVRRTPFYSSNVLLEALRGLEKYIKACRAMHVTSPQGLEKRAP